MPKLIKLKESDIVSATNIGVGSLRRSSNSRRNKSCENEVNLLGSKLISQPGDLDETKLRKIRAASSKTSNKHKRIRNRLKIGLISSKSCLNEGVQNKLPDKSKVPVNQKDSLNVSVNNVGLNSESNKVELDTESINKNKKLNTPNRSKIEENGIRKPAPDVEGKEFCLRSGVTGINGKSTNNKLSVSAINIKNDPNSQPLPISSSIKTETTNIDLQAKKIGLNILPLAPKMIENGDNYKTDPKNDKMNLRKKRSLGAMEDLWDESIFDENKKLKSDSEDTGSIVSKSDEINEESKPRTTPVLKISYGPGKGTVLKIPAKSTQPDISTNIVDNEIDLEQSRKNKDMSAKAAKKALRKAKKEAQRKAMFGGASPVSIVGGMSPRFGGMSPMRLGGLSPGRFGGTSPARFGGMSPARANNLDPPLRDLPPKKHKHKVKHKKKHKDERRHKSPTLTDNTTEQETKDINTSSTENPLPPDHLQENIIPEEPWDLTNYKVKDKSTTSVFEDSVSSNLSNSLNLHPNLEPPRHKLSISIKRVSNASYVACDPSQNLATDLPHSNTNNLVNSSQEISEIEISSSNNQHIGVNNSNSIHNGKTNTLEKQNEELVSQVLDYHKNGNTKDVPIPVDSDSPYSEDIGDVPDFPINANESMTLLMHLHWQEVDTCHLQGRTMQVGDVVWGKIHGFPWWPAKVS